MEKITNHLGLMWLMSFIFNQHYASWSFGIRNWTFTNEHSNPHTLIPDIYIYMFIYFIYIYQNPANLDILYMYLYMGVSKNSGTPKSSILIGFSIINHPFWGTPIFGNTHIYIYIWCISTKETHCVSLCQNQVSSEPCRGVLVKPAGGDFSMGFSGTPNKGSLP